MPDEGQQTLDNPSEPVEIQGGTRSPRFDPQRPPGFAGSPVGLDVGGAKHPGRGPVVVGLPPFEIRAIGSREGLTGSLTRIGGIVAQLSATYPSAVVTVTPVDALVLPATTRSLQPAYGTPRL